MSIFTKKHYKWLARYAARNLTDEAAIILAQELNDENPIFNSVRFHRAIVSEAKKFDEEEETP